MPTHRSLTFLTLALAQIFVAANARYERGIYLSEAPENINPDDLYNEMVYKKKFISLLTVDTDANEFRFEI